MRYTFVSDGSSDKVLVPILTWSLRRFTDEAIEDQWADPTRIPRQPDPTSRLRLVLEEYPCDLLFVHRDAEGQTPEERRAEVAALLENAPIRGVPVIPIRMTEAWLLFDESAIRSAAGNPNGTQDLGLPRIDRLEDLPDPKAVLHQALTTASGLNARRRGTFPVHQRVHRIADYLDDYSRLEALSAFRSLQADIRTALEA